MKSSEKEEDTRLQTLTTSTRIETKNSNIPLLARMYTVKRKDSISSSSDEEGIKRKAFIIKRDAPQVPIPSFGSEPKENSCVNRRNERQNFFIPKLVRLNGAITKRQESFNNCLDEAIESSFDSEAEEEPSKKLDKINLARISNDPINPKSACTSPKNLKSFRYFNSTARKIAAKKSSPHVQPEAQRVLKQLRSNFMESVRSPNSMSKKPNFTFNKDTEGLMSSSQCISKFAGKIFVRKHERKGVKHIGKSLK